MSPVSMPVGGRIAALDALRGIAALLVVLFHYTSRFPALYGADHGSSWALWFGNHGVELFFVISGFVITMTLARTGRAMDFVRARFARLFPAFWASVLLSWSLIHLLGLPGREVPVRDLLGSLTMIPELLGFRPVDGVYWSLEVELFFYAWMLLLWAAGQLRAVRGWMAAWVVVACIDAAALRLWGRHLPVLHEPMILQYIAFFSIGIVYWRRHAGVADRGDHALLAASIAAAFWIDGPVDGVTALVSAVAFEALVRGWLDRLATAPLLWAGAISYPLYVLHQNAGYALILALERHGLDPDLSMLATLAAACLAAWAITVLVERPALRWLRPRRAGAVAPVAEARP